MNHPTLSDRLKVLLLQKVYLQENIMELINIFLNIIIITK